MQNEISGIVLKEGFFGKTYGLGGTEIRRIYYNGAQRRFRAYAMTSDNVGNFVLYAPVSKGVAKVEEMQELELVKPKMISVQVTIGEGQDRNTVYQNAMLADEVLVKGGN